jgi:hypothetical protein
LVVIFCGIFHEVLKEGQHTSFQDSLMKLNVNEYTVALKPPAQFQSLTLEIGLETRAVHVSRPNEILTTTKA